MNVLAIHTATPEISVAAESDAGTFLISARGRKQQAEELLPFLEEAARNAGFSLKETHLITAAEGPGAFTGLRLSYAAAKAVQLSSGCPFIPVPTFAACAENVRRCGGLVLCVMDAKKKRFYAQFFKSGGAVSEIMDATPEAIAARAADRLAEGDVHSAGLSGCDAANNGNPGRILVLTGPDAALLAENPLFSEAMNAKPHKEKNSVWVVPTLHGAIFSMILLSKKLLSRYNEIHNPYNMEPMYIRRSDAECFDG